VVSSEDAAQIERLKYVLSHGVKEGLVERIREWPGVHAVQALTEGKVLEGYWFDRQQEYAARRRREDFRRLEYATRETLALDPLPCWRDLPEEQRRRLVTALAEEIEADAAAHRERTGIKPPGPGAILTQSPHRQPLKSKKSPAPAFHAASQAVRRELRGLYHEFAAAYREAAEKLRAGDRRVAFPVGSFPPALPFVGG
jgi:hypothetical protein